jgi:hypothetical protein
VSQVVRKACVLWLRKFVKQIGRKSCLSGAKDAYFPSEMNSCVRGGEGGSMCAR